MKASACLRMLSTRRSCLDTRVSRISSYFSRVRTMIDLCRTLNNKERRWLWACAVVVDPLTCMSPRTGLNGGMAILPFTCVRGGIRVKSSYIVVSCTDVLRNAGVKGKGGVRRGTILKTRPRSFRCAKRRDDLVVNSGGSVHRGIMVDHTAFNNGTAGVNGKGCLVSGMRLYRSMRVGGGYIMNVNAAVTKRYALSSYIVLDKGIALRRCYRVND